MNTFAKLTELEFERQKNTLNLIASENFPSPTTLSLLGSVWSNKYGEGYPGKRYYAGNTFTDQLEKKVQELAIEVFDSTGEYSVNVQTLSGSPANGAIYMSELEPGDTILSLSLQEGGHLSHLHQTSVYNKFFNYVNYHLSEINNNDFELDLDSFEEQLKKHQPGLTIIGFSAYTKQFDFAKLIQIAHQYNSLVLADISHIAGLVASGLHSSPFGVGLDGADYITTTTHKTLRGPRGALLFAKHKYIDSINKSIFPGLQGGPHFNKIAAIGNCLEEVLGKVQYPDGIDFEEYSKRVLFNTKALEISLDTNGVEIVSPTQNHLCLVKLPIDVDSLDIQNQLENLGIITNRNPIPKDIKSPWRPSGMRLGAAALTSRGLDKADFEKLGQIIAKVIQGKFNPTKDQITIDELIQKQNWFY